MTEQIFNTSQKNALAALGLPLWQQRQAPSANETVAHVSHCYRLGDWLLLLSERLPVKHPQWLRDLSSTLGQSLSTIAEVAESNQQEWDPTFIIHLNVTSEVEINAATKAQIWQQIQHQLS